MSLQKAFLTIRAAAGDQRGLADQCIHAPKAKASFLANAADLDAAAEELETLTKDGERLDHLEELIRQCPHAEFDYCDDDDERKPLGFSITLEGCSGKEVSVGLTFREAVDEDMKLTAKRNSE